MTALASSPIRRRSWGIRSALPRRAATAALWGQSERWRKRSEEHTSELQSLMRISYAVFCLNKKTNKLLMTFPSALYTPTIKIILYQISTRLYQSQPYDKNKDI